MWRKLVEIILSQGRRKRVGFLPRPEGRGFHQPDVQMNSVEVICPGQNAVEAMCPGQNAVEIIGFSRISITWYFVAVTLPVAVYEEVIEE